MLYDTHTSLKVTKYSQCYKKVPKIHSCQTFELMAELYLAALELVVDEELRAFTSVKVA